MIREGFQIDPQELSAIVPACYAEFRAIVADGLTFFLRQLSPGRQAEICQAQAALPVDAGLLRRLVLLLRACPALHKLAQVIARDHHLDLERRRHLQELESLEPHTPVEQWRPVLDRELVPAAEEYRICVDEHSLAEGSVAVVVPLTWSDPVDGPRPPRRQAVAKLLKPGIAQRLDEDLRILGRLADHLDEHWAAYGLPPLAYRETLEEVAELLTDEVQLRLEQAHLRRAARQFAGQSDLQVPRVLPFCTDAVTAMERVDGRKVADPRALPAWRRPAMFLAIVRGLLAQVSVAVGSAEDLHQAVRLPRVHVTNHGKPCRVMTRPSSTDKPARFRRSWQPSMGFAALVLRRIRGGQIACVAEWHLPSGLGLTAKRLIPPVWHIQGQDVGAGGNRPGALTQRQPTRPRDPLAVATGPSDGGYLGNHVAAVQQSAPQRLHFVLPFGRPICSLSRPGRRVRGQIRLEKNQPEAAAKAGVK
jgi:ubiquinone biosynthesis protein